jgi:hypothetical protein
VKEGRVDVGRIRRRKAGHHYRVEARLRQWTDDGHQLGAENTEQGTRNGRSQDWYTPFCAFCVLCGSPGCDPGTHFGRTVLVCERREAWEANHDQHSG